MTIFCHYKILLVHKNDKNRHKAYFLGFYVLDILIKIIFYKLLCIDPLLGSLSLCLIDYGKNRYRFDGFGGVGVGIPHQFEPVVGPIED